MTDAAVEQQTKKSKPAPSLTLHYFNGRGRAESCRLVLAVAKAEYLDDRLGDSEWPGNLKNLCPFGQLPAVELGDGVFIAQSASIIRFLGVRFDLSGSTDVQRAQVDSLIQTNNEYLDAGLVCLWNKNKDVSNEFDFVLKRTNLFYLNKKGFEDWKTKKLTTYCELMTRFSQKHSTDQQWLCGKSITIADIDMYRYLNEFLGNSLGVDIAGELNKWPIVKAIVDRVAANPQIAAYVSKRAVSEW